MKYFEIMVILNSEKSYYEGRFFIKSESVKCAVKKVQNFLEIEGSNEYEIYTKQLSHSEYLQNMKHADYKNKLCERLTGFSCEMDFDKVATTPYYMQFINLANLE